MRKNIVYELTVCNERNELAEALKEKKPAIEINGKLKEDLLAEIKSQDNGKLFNFFHGYGKVSTGAGLLGIIIPEVGIAEILGLTLSGILMQFVFKDRSEFSNYNIAFAKWKTEVILLVTKNFDSEYDSVKGYEYVSMIEPKRTKCPKCKEKLKDLPKEHKEGTNPGKCYKCHTPYVWFMEPPKASKKK